MYERGCLSALPHSSLDYTFISLSVWQSAVTPIVSGECSHRDRAGMASRVSLSQYRLEAEIERYRAECQWDKMPTMIDQLLAARFHEDGERYAPVGLRKGV